MPFKHSTDPHKLFAEVDKFKKNIPRIAGVESMKFFKQSFRRQGFHDVTLVKWQKRKDKKDQGRAILIKSGALRKSLRISRITKRGFSVSSELPYSAVHNEGSKAPKRRKGRSGRKGKKNMPKRQFMGKSRRLNRIIEKKLDRRLNRILR